MFDVAQPALVIPISPGMGGSSSTQVIASSGNVGSAGVATATIPAVVKKTSYLTGFDFTALGATNQAVVLMTVTDGTWTQTYEINVPATSALIQITPLTVVFSPPLAASAANTAIAVSCPSLGAGNTNVCVNARGFQQ